MPTSTTDIQAVLERVGDRARRAGVFGAVRVTIGRVECGAKASPSAAFYRLDVEGDRLWVSLVMGNRYLSQSIELDLVNSGDKLEELLEEELVELGYEGGTLAFEHFRSEDKLFTFRSPLPVRVGVMPEREVEEVAGLCLLGYEACFRRLGGMEDGAEGE